LTKEKITREGIILGIDPGTNVMGFGIIAYQSKKTQLIEYGSLTLSGKQDHFVRIKKIYDFTIGLIDQFLPDELAIESPFFGKNIQSMLKLGRAQGAAISAALQRSVPVSEYAPRKIKMAITGYGNASKEKVAQLLQSMLKLNKEIDDLDATDALAAAMCHYYEKSQVIPSSGKAKDWKAFAKNNPGRVK